MSSETKEVRLCDDIEFTSNDYALRESRILHAVPDPSLFRDMKRGKVLFSEFTILVDTEHPLVTKALFWTVHLSQRRAYVVDFAEIHSLANAIKPSAPNTSMSYLVDYLSLHDVLARQKYKVRIEKRKGKPFLTVYKGNVQMSIHPLSPIELAWLAKL